MYSRYEYITIFVYNTYDLIHKSKEYTSKKNRSSYVNQTSIGKSFHMGKLDWVDGGRVKVVKKAKTALKGTQD
jgi:hypothetical protein